MPFKVAANCKMCCYPDRAELERRLLHFEISQNKLAAELCARGDKTTPSAVSRHMADHAPITEDLKKRVALAKASADPRSEVIILEKLAEIEGLDEIFAIGREVLLDCKRRVLSGEADMKDALLVKWMMVEMREAIKAKFEMLNGKQVSINVADGLFGLLALADGPSPTSPGGEAQSGTTEDSGTGEPTT